MKDYLSGLKQVWLKKPLSFPRRPVNARAITFSKRDQALVLVAAVLFQTLYLFIIPLGFECDAAMYFRYAKSFVGAEGGGGAYYRAPGFPFFLVLSGQLLFTSFIPTVAAHAAMGILSPVLLYRTLAPAHRWMALAAAIVFILSTTPFYGTKLMLAEHLFAFSIVAMFYGFSRYYFGRDTRFIYSAVFFAFVAFFTRWEANVFFIALLAVLFFLARVSRSHLRHLVIAFGIVLTLGAGWSAVRSHALVGDASLFGSLHNWAGRQSFWMVYWGWKPHLRQWERLLGWQDSDETDLVMPPQYIQPPAYERVRPFVRLSNGPQTRKLRDMIVEIVSENPESYRIKKSPMKFAHQVPGLPPRDYYQESFGQFDGNPQAFADNFFANANGRYTDYVPYMLGKKIGISRMNELLGSVAKEALFANPKIIPLAMVHAGQNLLSFFGFDLHRFIKFIQDQPGGSIFPVMSSWGTSQYSDVYYNIGNCAEGHLPPSMASEIHRDHEITIPLRDTFFPYTDMLRNWVRNLVGLLALVSWWFLPFAPQRRFFLCLAALIIPYLVFSCSLGYGSYTRYELAVQPLIILLTSGGVLGLWSFIHNRVRVRH
jgi:hypothetical protein